MKKVFACMLILSAAALLTSSCGTSSPSRYYLLKSGENIPVNTIHHPHLENLRVVVAPTIIPRHLDRPVLISFSSEHELAYSEFERWGEPLGDNVTRVLIENLSQLLPGAHVMRKGLIEERAADFIIRPELAALRIEPGSELFAEMRWNIINSKSYASAAIGSYARSVPLNDEEEVTAVSAASDLLLEASRSLAAEFIEASAPAENSDPAL
ncbi:MAG: PqiC family protein [Kiritimatiellia bacterium]|jgi:uncharacterized lipoprotein YmbA